MKIELVAGKEALSARAASVLAEEVRAAVAARGRCALALSGGREPLRAFELLAGEQLPWDRVHLFQVDERVAPAGHADRNATHLAAALLDRVPVPPSQVHLMPVEAPDLEAAAAEYAAALAAACGAPPALDVVHLGIGADGHTASLVAGEPALEVTDADVTVTGVYQGRRRMTLTLPAIDRARRIVWLVAGEGKAQALALLRSADPEIAAARVRRDRALLLADAALAPRG